MRLTVAFRDPVRKDRLALRREDRFGVELDAPQVAGFVAQAHDQAAAVGGRDFQTVGKPLGRNHPRMVASGAKPRPQPVEERIVGHDADVRADAVVDFGEVLQPGAERLADGLFAEADAQNGFGGGVTPDQRQQQPRFGGDARTGREHDAVVGGDLVQRDAVVAAHIDFEPQFEQHVPQVVGERIVIIEKQTFHGFVFLRLIDQFPGLADGLVQRAELVRHLLQFAFGVALRDDARPGLIVKGVVAADECADGDGLVEIAVEPDEADAPAVDAAVVGLDLRNELHGPHLGSAAQRSGWESVDESADRIAVGVDLPADARDEVDDMAVILHVAVKVHLHAVGVAAQVVARQIDQHDVLGVLLGVGQKPFGPLAVQRRVSGAESRARDGVDRGAAVLDLAVRLGRGAEDAEAPEIEIEEVGRGIDAPQRTVDLEIVALKRLFEAAAQHDLEHVAAQAVAHALADHLPVGLVGEVRTALADRAEVVRSEITVLDQRLDLADVVPLAVGAQLDDRQFVLEVVEDQQELVEDVADVGGIGIAVVELPDGDVLEIAHRVERRIAEEAAKLAPVAVNAEFVQKFFQRVRRRTGFAEGLRNAPAVGVFQKRLAVVHADAGDGAEGDERKAVLTAVVVGTFE